MAKDAGDQSREKTRLCPACRMPISILATRCRHCGQKVDRPRDEGRRLTIATLGGTAHESYVPLGSVDLTEEAREGKLEPVLGRDMEAAGVLAFLAEENSKNVLIVGHPGAGKTQLVHGVAQAAAKAAQEDGAPEYRILELNLTLLRSGTVNMMDTVIALVDMLKAMPGLFVFIDGIRPLLDADASSEIAESVLGSAIRAAETGFICTMTVREYERVVAEDASAFHNFNIVRLDPLSEAKTFEILRNRRPSLEGHYRTHISDKALAASVSLTQRYLPDRCLPGKAVDVLVRACDLHKQKRIALSNFPAEWLDGAAVGRVGDEITAEHVRQALAAITSIDIDAAEAGLWAKRLRDRLKYSIVRQDAAVEQIAAALAQARLRSGEASRPTCAMLFGGPHGSGKFRTAQVLTYALLGSYDSLVTFDMAQYTNVKAVTRLFGSTPWQDANPDTGTLPLVMRALPFAVVAFAGIERAHSSFFEALMPILQSGCLRDTAGHEVSFKKCVLVLSLNCPTPPSLDAHTCESLRDVLLGQMRREVVERLDAIVPFRALNASDIDAVIRLIMRDFSRHLKSKNLGLRVQDAVFTLLKEQGYSPNQGAGNLPKTLERLIINPAQAMIEAKKVQDGGIIEVAAHNGEIAIRVAAPTETEG